MSDQYIGEIRIFAGNFAPEGWAFCNGQLLSIAENNELFALIGNRYGGDGQTTFAVPDLQGRVVLHNSQTYPLGQTGGTETVSLSLDQLPAHTHMPLASLQAGDTAAPEGKVWAGGANTPYTGDLTGAVAMNPLAILSVGGSQPHDNVMPFVAVSYIIALQGLFPSTD